MSETEAQTTKKRTKKDDYIVQGSILAVRSVGWSERWFIK